MQMPAVWDMIMPIPNNILLALKQTTRSSIFGLEDEPLCMQDCTVVLSVKKNTSLPASMPGQASSSRVSTQFGNLRQFNDSDNSLLDQTPSL
ncbi:hypothetical protein ACA910_001894 [Epithemia clementina (nom. ined.)]